MAGSSLTKESEARKQLTDGRSILQIQYSFEDDDTTPGQNLTSVIEESFHGNGFLLSAIYQEDATTPPTTVAISVEDDLGLDRLEAEGATLTDSAVVDVPGNPSAILGDITLRVNLTGNTTASAKGIVKVLMEV